MQRELVQGRADVWMPDKRYTRYKNMLLSIHYRHIGFD